MQNKFLNALEKLVFENQIQIGKITKRNYI